MPTLECQNTSFITTTLHSCHDPFLLRYSYLIQSQHLLHFSLDFIFSLTPFSETKSSYLFQTPLHSSLSKAEVSDSSLDLYSSFTYFLNDSDTFYLDSYTYRD